MRPRIPWLAAITVLSCPSLAGAQSGEVIVSLEAEQTTAVRTTQSDISLFRTTLMPRLEWEIDNAWQADAKIRFEIADDKTGLGSIGNYSPPSRPLIDSDNVRLEIDELVLTYRSGEGALSIGKQTVVWGTLDGIRVTDRFDAIRLRDFILTDTRPQRISRWGVRYQQETEGWTFDTAVAFDPTANQLGQDGDAFFPQASRFRGGIPPDVGAEINVERRDRYLEDATIGARVAKEFASATVAIVAISGPETEAIISPAQPSTNASVLLEFPRRELFGASADISLGSAVLRIEAAHIPNQPVNTLTQTPLSSATRPRTLFGVGADIVAPGDVFVNAQLTADHIAEGSDALVRPQTDVVSTLTARKSFNRDTITAVLEIAASLSDGDGLVRPRLEYDLDDRISIAVGGDVLFGPRHGQFGQFRDQSRLWMRVTLSI